MFLAAMSGEMPVRLIVAGTPAINAAAGNMNTYLESARRYRTDLRRLSP